MISKGEHLHRFPRWVVLNVPHNSTVIPDEFRDQFVLGDAELEAEAKLMADSGTLILFVGRCGSHQTPHSSVSRLVVDVERFRDDAEEPMAARGMGAIYNVTHDLKPLRRPITDAERAAVMQRYDAFHGYLERSVDEACGPDGCLVVDCHSFSDKPLPYEMADPSVVRPDVCIGTDAFHTPPELAQAFVSAFESVGWSVALDTPFTGAMVPASRYKIDKRVSAIMVEINKRLYLGKPLHQFEEVRNRINEALHRAITQWRPA
ncbi:N-formylglutamate amidohydrolase [soil metagenome]